MEDHRIFYFDNQPPGHFFGVKDNIKIALIPRLNDKVHMLAIADFIGIASADHRDLIVFPREESEA